MSWQVRCRSAVGRHEWSARPEHLPPPDNITVAKLCDLFLDHSHRHHSPDTYENYRHFLQLLAIKIRQREGQTLEIIKREMRETTGDMLERRIAQSLAPALGARADAAVARDDETPLAWRRVTVADGIEIHVRDDSPASSDDAVVAMREAVRAALGRADIRR